MCGICGIVERGGPVDTEALARMTAAIRHRGPDDDGFHVTSDDAGPGVGLGFRRLSIIDVEGGHQPLSNEDRTVWIVFNGEIYNFRALRADLERRGHRFATNTDTEVIVHLYEELGPRCVEQLNGMFALAIWDDRNRRLVLARDRFGKKPLYYAETPGGGLLFGSELKALREHPQCPRELDDESLSQYLALEYVPSPRSILRGVRKVPAAHVLTWQEGAIATERYWDLPFGDPHDESDEELVEEFRRLFRGAVERRLMSDVPLGAFLSGGIDSSAVVAMMAELLPRGNVKTFSIGFTERSFDESSHARLVADRFGTDHHEHLFTPEAMANLLPEVAAFVDEPFADASILPTYLLSRFTREQVTVALGGDGGDELLAGYPTFPADVAARLYYVPRVVHERLVLPLGDRLPVSTANFSLDFKVKRFLRGARLPEELRHTAWLGAFTADEQARLLVGGSRDPYASVRAVTADSTGRDAVQRLVYLYARTYLEDDILVKVDRASMATSLEVRAPFLDVELVEFLGRVPSNLKLRRFQTKRLLKRAMRGVLPDEIIDRPKKGFGIPVAAWLKGEFREALQDELSPERIRRQGLFDAVEVTRLVTEHLDGRRDHRKALWALFMFQLWHRTWLEPPSPTVSVGRLRSPLVT
jgi:asparagine synthase (glutamine-hydrolysing)